MKKLKDLKKIKEREISEKELKENEKDAKIHKLTLFTIPLVLLIILSVIYIFIIKIDYLLIPFAILFFVFLFGWDSNQRTCKNCRKWNSIVWIDNRIILKTTTEDKKNILGKDKKKREKINKTIGKCSNCGKEFTVEKIKKI